MHSTADTRTTPAVGPTPRARRERWLRPTLSLVVLAAVCLGFAVLFYQVVRPLALPVFLAAVFSMLAFPPYQRLADRCGGRRTLSALVVLAVLLIVVWVPLILGAVTSYERALDAIALLQHSARDIDRLIAPVDRIAALIEIDSALFRARCIEALQEAEVLLFQRAIRAVGGLLSFALGAVLFLVSTFFFLRDGEMLLDAWEALTPLDLEHDRKIRGRFATICRGVVLSTFLAALAQAVTLAVGLALINAAFDLHMGAWVVPLSLLTGVCAMVPLLGSTVVWLTLGVWLVYRADYAAGLLLMAHGALIVSNVDNLARMLVLRGTAGMHPLLSLVSILGGVELMGVLGVFIGPVVAGVFVSLLRILKQQLDEVIVGRGDPPDTALPAAAPPPR